MHPLFAPGLLGQAHRRTSYVQRRNTLLLATALTGSLVVSSALMDPARAQALTGDVVANNGDTVNITVSSTPNSVTNNGGEVLIETGGVTLTTNFVQQGGETRVAVGGTLTDTDGVVAISGGDLQNNGGGTISSAVSVSGGTLTASGGTFGGDVTISGTGTFDISGPANIGTTTLTGGNIDVRSNNTLTTDLVQSGGTTTINFNATLADAGGTTLTGGTITNEGTISNAVNVTGGTLNAAGGNFAGGVTIGGTGTFNVNALTSFGTTTITGGNIAINGSSTLITDLVQSGGTTTINSGATMTDAGGTTLTGGTIANSGTISNAVTLNGGTLTNSTGGTVNGLTTVQSGTLNASGGTFGGGVTAQGGTVNVTASQTLDLTNNGSVININTGVNLTDDLVNNSGTLNIAGTLTGNLTNGATANVTGTITGNVNNTSSLIFNHSNVSTYAGGISGTGSLTKSGAGVLTLTGTNSQTGSTTVGAGTLRAGSAGAFAANTAYTVNGGILDLNGHALTISALSGSGGSVALGNAGLTVNQSGTTTFAGAITGTGSMTKSGAGTLTLTGTNTHTGGTAISVGTLQIGNGGSSGSLTGDITNDAALIFNRSNAVTFSGNISGTGSLTKSGAGTLTLTGTSAHTGGTTISAGTLQVGDGGTTGSLGGNITNNAALSFNRSDALTYAGAVSGTGSLTKSGAGTLTLTGSNTNSGGTTISAGTLQIGNGGTNGSLTGNITNNGAITFNRSDALSYSGVISGTGSLSKSGAGTLILTGSNTFSGGTTISAGTLQVGNGGTSGSLIGNITNNSAITFNRSDALTYSGVISGTGLLTKSGAGTLILTGSNTFSGGTTISAGTLQIGNGGTTGSLTGNVINNAALAFNRSDAVTFGGNISGTGSLTKAGAGTLTLTGTNTYTGGTTVSAGKIVVNGSTGAITLNGATLGGSGTVGALTANSGSSVAPGNSIGTLNVTGNASFASGSTYAVEVDSAGNADKIAATGTVSIDSGATVSVSPENGTDTGSTYAASTTYTILTAGGGLTGTFGSVSDSFAFLDASLGYDANNVYLKLLRNTFTFASIASTANQTAAATGLDSLASGNAVRDAVMSLSAASARSAYDSLSGEVHASTTGIFIQDSKFARNAATNRIRDAFEGLPSANGQALARNETGDAPHDGGGAVVWGQGYGGWSSIRGNGNAAAIDHRTGGSFFGADTEIALGWRGGLLAGYGNTGFNVDARSSSGHADSYTFGAYAGGQLGAVGVRLGASYALHDVSASRNVTAGALRNALSADYTASTTQVFGEAGCSIDTGGARFEPFAGFALIHQRSGAFTESGGAAALSVASTRQTLGVTTLGLRAERQVSVAESYTATLGGSLAWRHTIGGVGTASTMRFAGGNAFDISGVPLDRDTALIEAGLKLDFDSGAHLNLDYQGELGAGTQSHGVAARFSMSF